MLQLYSSHNYVNIGNIEKCGKNKTVSCGVNIKSEMSLRHGFRRSHDVKEVIHIRANKHSGYFNSDCKQFAIDPHVTTFADIREILVNAFNLTEFFEVTYLCRDDRGENMYLSLQTEWDLDAAFLTSSEPYLILKIEIGLPETEDCQEAEEEIETYVKDAKSKDFFSSFGSSTRFQVPRGWSEFAGNAIAKIASGISQNITLEQENNTFFPKKSPLGDCELHEYLDDSGRLVKPEDMRLRIYYGGVEPCLRKVVWRLLLNIFPDKLTAEERVIYMKQKTKEYHSLYTQWKALEDHNKYIQELKKMIWKDVLRTDRTHPYYAGRDDNPHLLSLHNLLLTYALTHKNVRYCQGMSDIASPILMVMNNEPHAYVCFCGAMNRLETNFDSAGEVMMKKFEHLSLLLRHHDDEYFEFLKELGASNMYFCYRWLVLEMKREFSFDDALLVLEVMWSSLPPQSPDGDLVLGTLNIDNEYDCVEKESSYVKAKKRHSMPNLTLNVKSLPTLNVVSSYNNLKQLGDNRNAQTNFFPSISNPFGNASKYGQGSFSSSGDTGIGIFSPRSRFETDSLSLPPPEEFGCGNPFLLFVCLAVLLSQKQELMDSKVEYADLVMHFDKLSRKHSPAIILSRAMQLFASYLKSQAM
uniref:TBC1 domain family member 25-like n=1 Tax=Styela clava TaxID=7725 RepID=UPI00193A2156|nr:TBC1 domain family member 25-like [Styela clava]